MTDSSLNRLRRRHQSRQDAEFAEQRASDERSIMGVRRSGIETRALILSSTSTLLTGHDGVPVTVVSVMRHAGVSRTAFYRQFSGIHQVFAELLIDVQADLIAESGSWVTDPEAVGSPEVVRPNLERYARSFTKYADLLTSLHNACGSDPELLALWREEFIQPFADASEASIIRDQAAGAVSPQLDAAAAATALTLLGQAASLELLGRRHVSPSEYADIVGPVWTATLFGVVPGE